MNLLVKPVAALLGAFLVLIGLWSYVLSGTLILSVFHALTGLMALYAFSSSQLLSHRFLVVTGIAYALITVFGFFLQGDIVGFFPVTTFDNYLHLVISIACLIVGVGSGK